MMKWILRQSGVVTTGDSNILISYLCWFLLEVWSSIIFFIKLKSNETKEALHAEFYTLDALQNEVVLRLC